MLTGASVAPGQRFSFKHYDQNSGLNSMEVQELLQDRRGLLWLATQNGLYRYNGRHFRAYSTSDGLPSMQVWTLAEGADGTLWAGTSVGIARLEGDRFVKVDFRPARGTRSMVTDSRNHLFIASDRGLVVGRMEGSRSGSMNFQLYPNPAQAKGKAAFGVGLGPDGRVWYGCGRSMCVFDGNGVAAPESLGAPPDQYEGVAVCAGSVWARSLTGLIELPPGGDRWIVRGQNLAPASRVGQLYVDHSGNLFVPTSQGLVWRQPGGSWETIGKKSGLPSENVGTVFEDREGSLWIGLNGAGLARWLGRRQWESWTQAEGLPDDEIWSVRRDRRGVLWAAGRGGLSSLDEKSRRWIPWRHPALGANRILTITVAEDDTLWLARNPGGVVKIDPERKRAIVYDNAAGLSEEQLFGLAVDREGHVWAGTRKGLFEGTGGPAHLRFQRRVLPDGEPDPLIAGLAYDRQQRLWVATWHGLFVREAGRWRRFSTRDGLRRPSVCYLANARDGSMWITYCESAGMSRVSLQGNRLQVLNLSQADGMRTAKPFGIDVDPAGRIWVEGDHGIEVFDGRTWRPYDKTDGLVWNDCNSNAILADRDGSVWIGTPRGLSHFYAVGARPRSANAPVVLTEIRLGNRGAPLTGGISVPYSARTFHAEFAAPTFVNEESVRVRYRLAGLDTGWTETDNDEAHYAGLSSGGYVFEVQASADGKWIDPPARYSFRIQPPWWLSWWSLMGDIAAGYGIVRLILAWRLRHVLRRQAALEAAVESRTRELTEEKRRAEHEKAVVEKQKVEIERLFHMSEEASRLKNEFLANISHEIRTPMNGIIGMTELVLRTELKEDQAECLRLVRLSADALLSVINDVLDYSKIEAGRLDLDIGEFEPHALLRDTIKSMEVLARNKGLALACSIAPEVPAWLQGDAGRLRQILLNLVGNAIKFTGQGSVDVEVTMEDGALRVAVHDTGIGIPEDKLKLIFEPFRQADGSTSRRYGGTGLGLAICARLVDLMGGRIWVESRPGEGTDFYFTAKVEIADSHAAQPGRVSEVAEEPVAERSLRVLLAEDNMVNQKLASRILAHQGHEVICVSNGLEAVGLAAQEHFDIVLMDLQMPQMDGFEATAEIRKLDAALRIHTPILALTANAMKGDRERCLDAGMDGYVPKPLKPAELLQAIRDLTRR